MKAKFLLVQTGPVSEPTLSRFGDFDSHVRNQSRTNFDYDLVRIYHDQPIINLDNYQGVLISGSSAMVDENLPWMRTTIELIEELFAKEIPLLGICFGHQLMGQACKAQVGPHPEGRHQGSTTVTIKYSDSVIPQTERFTAQISHRDSILNSSPYFEAIGTTEYDPHHIIKVGNQAWGVQFHPEWNLEISRTYVEKRKDLLIETLGEAKYSIIRNSLKTSETASSIIDNFIRFAQDH